MSKPIHVADLALPFGVGATSYIVPDDLLPNARHLAGRVDDMQLVLFDTEDGISNIPSAQMVDMLAKVGRAHGLSYTVHLLQDLDACAHGSDKPLSLISAQEVIELTRPLEPWAYVGHLNGKKVRGPEEVSSRELATWQCGSARATRLVSGWTALPERLALENLEGFPPDLVTPVVAQTGASRCVDVGHLWLDGYDPVPYLEQAWARLRVVHLHGLMERDHQSLDLVPPPQLDRVVRLLLERRYAGVLTLEVFGEDDFETSLLALAESVWRCRQKVGD